jgi:hypothetical protein
MRAAEVLRLVSGALQDLEPGLESRWPWEGGDDGRIGLLDFLNESMRVVVMQRPDAFAITEPIRLEPGMRQRMPSKKRNSASRNAATLIELVRNLGQDGDTPGQAIVSAQPSLLLAWADATRAARSVENFAYDRLTNPNIYYVYPAVCEDADVWVEATYSAAPEAITSPEQEIGLPEGYAAALKHHILASILSGDNESSNASKASLHLQLYAQILGIKLQVDAGWPKAKSTAPAGGAA